MGRSKPYDKRFHFWGPAEFDQRARSLAGLRGAAGGAATSSDVLREALSVGLDVLESGARYAPRSSPVAVGPLPLDPDLVTAAVEAVEDLVELGGALRDLDVDAVRALAHLDVDVLRALGRLDTEALDALALLDIQPLTDLADLDVRSYRTEHHTPAPTPSPHTQVPAVATTTDAGPTA